MNEIQPGSASVLQSASAEDLEQAHKIMMGWDEVMHPDFAQVGCRAVPGAGNSRWQSRLSKATGACSPSVTTST